MRFGTLVMSLLALACSGTPQTLSRTGAKALIEKYPEFASVEVLELDTSVDALDYGDREGLWVRGQPEGLWANITLALKGIKYFRSIKATAAMGKIVYAEVTLTTPVPREVVEVTGIANETTDASGGTKVVSFRWRYAGLVESWPGEPVSVGHIVIRYTKACGGLSKLMDVATKVTADYARLGVKLDPTNPGENGWETAAKIYKRVVAEACENVGQALLRRYDDGWRVERLMLGRNLIVPELLR